MSTATLNTEWKHRMYGSGTQIVTRENPGEPWLYIYGPRSGDETQMVHDRWKVCEDIMNFLNGGERPMWLDDMERKSEILAEDLDGTKISAAGPLYDADPPNLLWRLDESDEAKDARARLMDRLFLKAS